MCEVIVIVDDLYNVVRIIETVGEAKAEFRELVFDTDVHSRATPPQDRECLCWLDMSATAQLTGFIAEQGGDPFEWYFRPAAKTEVKAI